MQTATAQTTDPLPASEEVIACEPPLEVRVGEKGGSLTLHWAEGGLSTFSAPFLRDNSQSARSKKLRLSGLSVPAAPDIAIQALRPIGAYAVNIVFSDGYDRGIYPWAYLRQLAETERKPAAPTKLTAEDFLKGN